MAKKLRGADLLVEALVTAGTKRIFTVSGNQVMSVFDACIDADIELIHTRHEAAAVHMADAWGRLTGEPGVALVTAGPGMANTLNASYVAMMAESPAIVLSGRAESGEAGRGVFQEMAQAQMAGPVAKASWSASMAGDLGRDVARAFAVATSGRLGPVHLSLPVDLLESDVERRGDVRPSDFRGPPEVVDDASAERVLDALAAAQRPLVLAGPAMMRGRAAGVLASLADTTRVPVVGMESPRGINDPSLGAFAEVLATADLIALLGKKLDFSLRFGRPPAISPDCSLVQIDSEATVVDQTRRALGDSNRLALSQLAAPIATAERLASLAGGRKWPASDWYDEVRGAIAYRPPEWTALGSGTQPPIHAAAVGGAIQDLLSDEEAVFISDGGEFGQWAQACVSAPHRVINGPSGSIGSAIPFALAARTAFPQSRIVAVLGDGTFGFHAMEFDTAVRYQLPFVAVVGNDAAWNAEYQIQMREYGPDRLVGCELLPSRYDEVVSALGGHGEHVVEPNGLRPALNRALASGRPACVNVMVGRNAAPVVRRGGG